MELNQRNKKIEEETFEFGRAQITTTTSVFDEPKSELQKLKSSRKLDKKPRMPVVDPPVKIRTELYKSKKDQISKANRKLEDLNKVCGDRRRPDDYCRGRDCGDSEHEKSPIIQPVYSLSYRYQSKSKELGNDEGYHDHTNINRKPVSGNSNNIDKTSIDGKATKISKSSDTHRDNWSRPAGSKKSSNKMSPKSSLSKASSYMNSFSYVYTNSSKGKSSAKLASKSKNGSKNAYKMSKKNKERMGSRDVFVQRALRIEDYSSSFESSSAHCENKGEFLTSLSCTGASSNSRVVYVSLQYQIEHSGSNISDEKYVASIVEEKILESIGSQIKCESGTFSGASSSTLPEIKGECSNYSSSEKCVLVEDEFILYVWNGKDKVEDREVEQIIKKISLDADSGLYNTDIEPKVISVSVGDFTFADTGGKVSAGADTSGAERAVEINGLATSQEPENRFGNAQDLSAILLACLVLMALGLALLINRLRRRNEGEVNEARACAGANDDDKLSDKDGLTLNSSAKSETSESVDDIASMQVPILAHPSQRHSNMNVHHCKSAICRECQIKDTVEFLQIRPQRNMYS